MPHGDSIGLLECFSDMAAGFFQRDDSKNKENFGCHILSLLLHPTC